MTMSEPRSLFQDTRHRLFCWCGEGFRGAFKRSRLHRHMKSHPREWGW